MSKILCKFCAHSVPATKDRWVVERVNVIPELREPRWDVNLCGFEQPHPEQHVIYYECTGCGMRYTKEEAGALEHIEDEEE